jgi:hypothetical protein
MTTSPGERFDCAAMFKPSSHPIVAVSVERRSVVKGCVRDEANHALRSIRGVHHRESHADQILRIAVLGSADERQSATSLQGCPTRPCRRRFLSEIAKAHRLFVAALLHGQAVTSRESLKIHVILLHIVATKSSV